MKFIIQREEFLNALKTSNSICENSYNSPILSSLLITVENNHIEISSMNNNIFSKTTINSNITINKTGKILIKGSLLFNIVSKIEEKELTLEAIDTNVVRISTNSFSSDINLIESESFPIMNFNFTNWSKIELGYQFLIEVLRKMSNCVENIQEKTSVFNGILFDSSRLEDQIEIVGTDSYHLAYLKTPYKGEKIKIVVDSLILKKVLDSSQKAPNKVNFYLNENKIILEMGNSLFSFRMIDSPYPSISKILDDQRSFKFEVNKRVLLYAIERVRVVADVDKKPIIHLKLNENKMNISCRSIEYGSSYEEIPISNYNGEVTDIYLNVKYLLDLIKNIDSDEITFELNSQVKPIVLLDKKNKEYFSLILPIKNI